MIRDETSWVPRTVAEREAARADAAEAKAARLLARLDRVDRVNPSGVQAYNLRGRYLGSVYHDGGPARAVAAIVEDDRWHGTGHDVILKHHGEPLATIRDAPGGPVVEWAEDVAPPADPDAARRWRAEVESHWQHGLEDGA
jgi:hypothetical protein